MNYIKRISNYLNEEIPGPFRGVKKRKQSIMNLIVFGGFILLFDFFALLIFTKYLFYPVIIGKLTINLKIDEILCCIVSIFFLGSWTYSLFQVIVPYTLFSKEYIVRRHTKTLTKINSNKTLHYIKIWSYLAYLVILLVIIKFTPPKQQLYISNSVMSFLGYDYRPDLYDKENDNIVYVKRKL